MIFGLRELQERRERLVSQCAELRESIAAAVEPIAAKAAPADRIFAAVRQHPILATIAAGAVAGLVPRAMPQWLTRVLVIWSLLKRR